MTYELIDLRIIDKNNRFLIQKKRTKWTLFGLKEKWVDFSSYSGILIEPFYFQTFDSALSFLLKEIRIEINLAFEFSD